jgi:hypothetical protein
MAYCTVGEVKEYLGPLEDADDALLGRLIDAATGLISTLTNKKFQEDEEPTTRYFDAELDVIGRSLWLDDYLFSIDSITNGDGNAIPSTAYVTRPANRAPFFEIRLRANSGFSWTYQDSPEDAIAVKGQWVFSLSPPADIVQACIRLVAWMYRMKDSQVFEQTAFTEIGVARIRAQIPADILETLDRYRNLTR